MALAALCSSHPIGNQMHTQGSSPTPDQGQSSKHGVNQAILRAWCASASQSEPGMNPWPLGGGGVSRVAAVAPPPLPHPSPGHRCQFPSSAESLHFAGRN